MTRRSHWLFEALERAEPFLTSENPEAKMFGGMLVLDRMPADTGDLRLLQNVLKTGLETMLTERHFDPVKFITDLTASERPSQPDQAHVARDDAADRRKPEPAVVEIIDAQLEDEGDRPASIEAELLGGNYERKV